MAKAECFCAISSQFCWRQFTLKKALLPFCVRSLFVYLFILLIFGNNSRTQIYEIFFSQQTINRNTYIGLCSYILRISEISNDHVLPKIPLHYKTAQLTTARILITTFTILFMQSVKSLITKLFVHGSLALFHLQNFLLFLQS